jgi:hypothetical protein
VLCRASEGQAGGGVGGAEVEVGFGYDRPVETEAKPGYEKLEEGVGRKATHRRVEGPADRKLHKSVLQTTGVRRNTRRHEMVLG